MHHTWSFVRTGTGYTLKREWTTGKASPVLNGAILTATATAYIAQEVLVGAWKEKAVTVTSGVKTGGKVTIKDVNIKGDISLRVFKADGVSKALLIMEEVRTANQVTQAPVEKIPGGTHNNVTSYDVCIEQ